MKKSSTNSVDLNIFKGMDMLNKELHKNMHIKRRSYASIIFFN